MRKSLGGANMTLDHISEKMTSGATMALERITATMTCMMWPEKHLWNISVLRKVHISNVVNIWYLWLQVSASSNKQRTFRTSGHIY
jgi:hypothetical protein